jgi:hypothetical protein
VRFFRNSIVLGRTRRVAVRHARLCLSHL